MLGDGPLAEILDAARRARPDIVFRVATRMPVVMPSRVTAGLAGLLREHAPLWVVVQVNHPAELNTESAQALGIFTDAGIPVISQTVLLAGVNDAAETLDELFTALVRLRVKPYYLFQGDLAPGTAHFRVNLARSLEIVAELRRRLSGLAMPTFAVDIPGGAGKVPLEPSAVVGEDEIGYRLRAVDGQVYHYPKEER
jgi:lysine 2,3-aminomutase